jgi:hypothetical protein
VGPDRNTHIRNIAIVLLLAVAVWQVPGGGTGADLLRNIFSVLFLGGIFFFGYRLYMEHRDTILGLEERQRGLLYGAIALALFAIIATNRLWRDYDVVGGMVWMLMLGAAAWAIYSVWRSYKTY